LIQGFLLEASLSRGDLTEAEWRVLKGLLPIDAANRGAGRPPEENRSIINGILWRLRCGTPWRDVPPKYGNWNTIYRRFRRWSEAGVWEAVSVTLAEIMADSGHYSIDSTTVRAHVSAAGGEGRLCECFWSIRRRHPMRAFPAKAAMAAPSGKAS
jgi:transposase